MTIKGVGLTIEELCWGEGRALSGKPLAHVSIVAMDGPTMTGAWRLDRNMAEWLVDDDQKLWVRVTSISRFKVVPLIR